VFAAAVALKLCLVRMYAPTAEMLARSERHLRLAKSHVSNVACRFAPCLARHGAWSAGFEQALLSMLDLTPKLVLNVLLACSVLCMLQCALRMSIQRSIYMLEQRLLPGAHS
jgi:hypothetical protein